MHHVIDIETLGNEQCNERGDRRRKFMWHELVIRDPLLTPTAYRYAGLVMHDYYLNRNGYSSISARTAAQTLRVSPGAIQKARNALVIRGWLKRIEGTGQHIAQYEIAFANVDFIARDMRFKQPPEVAQAHTAETHDRTVGV
jgi:hypothetical protein